jgi:amino acid adenylation domain-containing protein
MFSSGVEVRDKNVEKESKVTIEGFRLSPQQARLWLLQQDAQYPPYNSECVVLIKGLLDARLLEAALNQVVRRHEILRTTFRRLPAMTLPLQVISEKGQVMMRTCDLNGQVAHAQEGSIESLLKEAGLDEAGRMPFDFERGPMLQTTLARLAPERHLLSLRLPALCADAASLENLAREISRCYAACFNGAEASDEPSQYADLAEWQNELLESAETRAGRDYWRERSLSAPLAAPLPFENRRAEKNKAGSAPGAFTPRSLPVAVEPHLAAQIEALAHRHGSSIKIVLQACWHILLWRGVGEILIGVSYDGRNYEGLQGALGLFERYLPIYCHLEEDFTFVEVLSQLDESAREAQAWQECFTWEQIDEKSVPFFPLCYEYSEPYAGHQAGSNAFSVAHLYACTDRFKLKLAALRRADRMTLDLHYDAGLFARDDVERLAGQFLALLGNAVAAPGAALKELSLLAPRERDQILRQFNPPPTSFSPRPIHHLIEAQAALKPEATAVVVEDQQLSYGELNRCANQLAHHLRSLGVGPEDLVGLCLDRSVELVVGMLAILKAGGAYLPLDPTLPADRLAGMIADAGLRVMVTQERLRNTECGMRNADMTARSAIPNSQSSISDPQSANRNPVVVCLDTEREMIARESEENPCSNVGAEHLVYVLFTSGSTGRPKGVAVEHRQLHAYLEGVRERLGLPDGASYATVTTFAADLGHTAIFPALCGGGTLHVVSKERAADATAMSEYFRRHEIDCLKIVPSHLKALLGAKDGRAGLPRRRLVLGGEASSWELIGRAREKAPELRILNHYGPTETTVGVLTCEVEQEGEYQTGSVPLGRPLKGARVYVLDGRMEPAAVWGVGEVYVGGAQVARGYLNEAEQTAVRFVPDPFSEQGGTRLYRTGDLGRYLPDGRVEFLGRADHQVKIRGYRIELGEIEAALRGHAGVVESVVVIVEREAGEKRLVGYVVAREGMEIEGSELRRYVSERLPEYMVPGAIVKLERMPLTANGKLDRGALPEPESEVGGEYVAPRTQIEELVAGAWAEVLKLDEIGAHDDFFGLGGHSLLVTRVASRVSEAIQIEIPFQIFFEKRTVAELAESIEAALRGEQGLRMPPVLPVPRDRELPLSFAQQRLWFFDQLEPNSPAYNIPWAVRLAGRLASRALEQTLNEILRRHEVLRTSFPAVNGRPAQVIAEPRLMSLPIVDLSDLPQSKREAEARRLVAEEAVRPFRLDQGPLLRGGLVRLREDDHILLFTMHHIISDAWSMGALVREVAALYAAFSAGNPSPLPEPSVQYADYAHWQREWLRGEVLDRHVSYWKERLDGIPAALRLPTDRPRPAAQTFRGERHFLELSRSLTEALKAMGRREGATLFMTLLAAFKVLMRYYAAQDDIVVGTNVANRNHSETGNMVGVFVNQLVLRADLSGDPGFLELLSRVRRVALGAYAHQDLPFEKLVEELQPHRDMSRSLLFQVKFEMQEGITRVLELPGLTLTPMESDHKVVRHDLHLSMWEREQTLIGALQYNIDLFSAGAIGRIAGDFVALLEMIAEEPDARLSVLEERLLEKNRSQQMKEEKELEEASLKMLRSMKRKTSLSAKDGRYSSF